MNEEKERIMFEMIREMFKRSDVNGFTKNAILGEIKDIEYEEEKLKEQPTIAERTEEFFGEDNHSPCSREADNSSAAQSASRGDDAFCEKTEENKNDKQ